MPSKKLSSKELFSKAMFLQSWNNYAPLPIVYFIVLFMVAPMSIFMMDLEETSSFTIYSSMADLPSFATSTGLPVVFMLGCLLSLMVFRYLYNNRASNMVHSLPIRRETLFITQYITGLSFVILPNILIAICTCIALSFQGIFFWTPVLYCLLSHCLAYFFFFSFGVFCCVFTGSGGSVVLFFLTFNFLAMFLAALLDPIFEAFLLGYAGSASSSDVVFFLTPIHVVAQFFTVWGDLKVPRELKDDYAAISEYTFSGSDITFSMTNMTPMFIYLAVAVVMVVVALFVYKGRHIESAGEAVAVPKMKPVFRLFVSTLGGISVGMLFVVFITFQAGLSDYQMQQITPFICVFWAIVFTFVAEMVLQKSFRVLKYWKGCIYSVLTVSLIFASIVYDFTGFERRIPAQSQVLDVQFGFRNGMSLYPRDSINLDYLAIADGRVTSNQYQAFSALHRVAIDLALEEEINPTDENLYLPDGGDFSGPWKGYPVELSFYYYDDDGSSLHRDYELPYFFYEENSIGQYLLEMVEDPEQIAFCIPLEQMKDKVIDLNLSNLFSLEREIFESVSTSSSSTDALALSHYTLDEKNAFYDELLEAIGKDLDEGNLGQKYLTPYDQDYIDNGLYLSLDLYWTTAESDIKGYAEAELVTSNGLPLRTSSTNPRCTTLIMTQQAVHILAVLEEHGLFDEYQVMTYVERMEQEMIWATSHSKTEREKASSIWQDYDEDQLSDIMTFVPIIT